MGRKVEHICAVYEQAQQRALRGEVTLSLDEMTGIQALEGQTGILKSMASRAQYLAAPNHLLVIHYTPKHCSWMNQIEIWFGILVRKLLRRGNFTSTDNLKARILEFVDYFNLTMAKPFKWTYKGKPLAA